MRIPHFAFVFDYPFLSEFQIIEKDVCALKLSAEEGDKRRAKAFALNPRFLLLVRATLDKRSGWSRSHNTIPPVSLTLGSTAA